MIGKKKKKKSWTFKQWNIFNTKKKWSHEKTWRNLKCILQNEANLKRLYIWIQVYDILEMAELWEQ